MGVPVLPLAAAYGLGLGHIAGTAFYNHYMRPQSAPSRYSGLTTSTHSRRSSTGSTIKGSGAQTSTAQTMKRGRSSIRTRTRRGKRRRGGRGRRRLVPMQWPRFRLVKFRVVTQFSFGSTGGTGAVNAQNIGANTLSDPHYSLGGNLPLGLDQWAAMYKKYAVVGSRHFVKVHNVTSTGSICYGLTVRQGGESSTLANAEAYLELPMTKSRILSPDVDHSGLGISYNARRYWGIRKFLDADTQHGVFSTTPGDVTRPVYVQFWAEDVNRTTDFTVEGYVTSEYVCLLFDPVTPTRSAL